MSPYKSYDAVAAKAFSGSTLEELENDLNRWLEANPCNVIHLAYQHTPNAGGKVYSCLIMYSLVEYEVEM